MYVCSQSVYSADTATKRKHHVLLNQRPSGHMCSNWQPKEKKTYPLKEITYETPHLQSLKHLLIRSRVIGQEPLSATNQTHKTYEIRICFGVQIQILRTIALFLHAADRSSKTF